MAAVVADLGECGKSPFAKGERSGDLVLFLAYQRICGVLQTTPGGLALEQASSEVLAGVMFCMGPKAPQLLSRTREHALGAWSDALASGPRQKGADLIAGVPVGFPLGPGERVCAVRRNFVSPMTKIQKHKNISKHGPGCRGKSPGVLWGLGTSNFICQTRYFIFSGRRGFAVRTWPIHPHPDGDTATSSRTRGSTV
jgi:hypothetical protein